MIVISSVFAPQSHAAIVTIAGTPALPIVGPFGSTSGNWVYSNLALFPIAADGLGAGGANSLNAIFPGSDSTPDIYVSGPLDLGGAVTVTGDPTSASILFISVPGYTVTNNGILDGRTITDLFGQVAINATAPVAVVNNGQILTDVANDAIRTGNSSSVTNNVGGVILAGGDGVEGGLSNVVINSGSITSVGDDGVELGNGSSVGNAGLIQAVDNGVIINGSAVSIVNAATITGDSDASGVGNGVAATLNLGTLTNSGSISGATGVSAGGTGTINNTGVITGTTGLGVNVTGQLTLNNSGAINGVTGGVSGGVLSSLTNSGVISASNGDGVTLAVLSSLTNTGVVSGAGAGNDGVQADILTTVNNGGIITGADNGVEGTIMLTVNNTGVISGGNNGVSATTLLTLGNDGLIQGTVNGILAGDVANVTNTGAISGGTGSGISAGNNLTLVNGFVGDGIDPGAITGSVGVSALLNANITNNEQSLIQGLVGAGITSGDGLHLTNDGAIIGATDGVDPANNVVVVNNGSIIGVGGDGIDELANLNVTNNGSIIGGAGDGIHATTGAIVTNNTGGSILGSDDGIDVTANATITNALGATITGTADAGVAAGNDLDLTNSGAILGGTNGVTAGDGADITNNATGNITGTNGDGLSVGNSADVTNDGIILGSGDEGIDAGDNLELTNNGTITGRWDGVDAGNSATITNNASGSINGNGGQGVDAGNNLILDNAGDITGDDDGVRAGLNASIDNLAGGSIVGENDDGIQVGDNATITNAATATIDGQGGNGIEAGDSLSLTNDGLVQGAIDGVNAGDNTDLIDNNLGGQIVGTSGDGVSVGDNLALLSNAGTITGGDSGVQAGFNATIHNESTGVITGLADAGIDAGDQLHLTNDAGGQITGFMDGVDAGSDAVIHNYGTITGNFGDGVNVGADAIVFNHTGGVIDGNGDAGVQAGDNLNLTNDGQIEGTNDGVNATDNAVINNHSGATITGINDDGIQVGDGAVVTNGGTIDGQGDEGIEAGNNLDLTNDGSITGYWDGVDAGDNAVIHNHEEATITGKHGDGVDVGDNAAVYNDGTIDGQGDNGVVAGSDLYLENTGSITGYSDGVNAGDFAEIHNDSTITGLHDDGVDVGNSAYIVNNGTIDGQGDNGVQAADDLNLVNNNTITGNNDGVNAGDFAEITNNAEATITGVNDDGVDVGDFATIINNGLIDGQGDEGVEAGDNLNLTNNAIIQGYWDGVDAGDFATVTNNAGATITGLNGDGVDAGESANVTNNGSITGSDDGVVVDDFSTVTNNAGAVITGLNGDGVDFDGSFGSTLNNSGTINGFVGGNPTVFGTAFDGSGGDDVLNLSDGSVLNGDVLGRGNDIIGDTINFNGGLETAFGYGDTSENIIHGDVLGVEFINKDGSGFAFIGDGGLDFDGNTITDPLVSVETDTVNVNSGGLVINGNVIGTDGVSPATINVAGGAELDGTGVWTANVFLNDGSIFSPGAVPISLTQPGGPITPEQAIGSLTVVGTVTDAVAYRFDVAPQTPIIDGVNSDLLTATTYVINGMNLHISPTNIDRTITNGTYTLIATDNPVNIGGIEAVGVQFNSNIPDEGGYVGTEVYHNLGGLNEDTVLGGYFAHVYASNDGTDVLLDIEHNYAGLPGLNATQSAIGHVLDVKSNDPDPAIQDFIAALDYSNLAYVRELFGALDPSASLGLTASVINSDYRVHRLVQEHLFGLRNVDEAPAPVPSSAKDAKGTIAPAPAAPTHNFTVWGTASYDWQDLGNSNVEGDVGSFTVGFDWRINPTLVVGALLDGSKADIDYGAGGSDIDSLRGAIYGTWGASTGLYSDFLLGYGGHDMELDHASPFGAVLNGSSDATSLQALWTIGYTFGDQKVKHGPFAGFEYQNVDVDGVGGTAPVLGVPVAVGGYDVDSLRGLIGYRVNANLGTFRPYASIAYAHEFGDDSIETTGTLGGIFHNAAFTVYGPELSSAILLTAGTGIVLTDSLMLDVGYRGEISVDGDGVDSHGGSIGLSWSF